MSAAHLAIFTFGGFIGMCVGLGLAGLCVVIRDGKRALKDADAEDHAAVHQ